NTVARRALGIYSTAIGEDLIHSTQGVQREQLREAIDDAFHGGMTVGVDELLVADVTNAEQRFLQMLCYPQRLDDEEQEAIETVLITLQDVPALVQARRRLEEQLQMTSAAVAMEKRTAEEEATGKDQIIRRLVETNRQLIEANQELTSANEELRATAEEYLLNTEEAQAAIEEVETLNEELQATNEELETLNEELQATIEELNTTNDDLHARSIELQELAATSEEERARLAAILSNMTSAVLLLDANGVALLTNEAYARMFGD